MIRPVIFALSLALCFVAAPSASAAVPLSEKSWSPGEFSVRVKLEVLQYNVGNVQLGYAPMPEYPADLFNTGLEGSCEVILEIKTDGSVENVRLGKKSNKEFGDAALAAVGKWRFKRSAEGGHAPQDVSARVTFFFSIIYE